MFKICAAGALLGVALHSSFVHAHPDDLEEEVIVIAEDAPAESASSVHFDRDDLRVRPRTQPSDILRQVPGLVVSQHAGGGKSDQYFIRGFDADHGTDIAIFADGVPVNLTSHGHGQGYADTHFLIPETIDKVDVRKGPYAARFGDFYTAGALELKTIDEVKGPTLWTVAGSSLTRFGLNRRIVGMASPKIRDDDKSLVAVELTESDGPFVHEQDFQHANALLKWRGRVGRGELRAQLTSYLARWNQSGQIPASEVAAGRLDRFGAIDPTEGGNAHRTSAQVAYTVGDWKLDGYAVRNDLTLFSNFTLFARDPVHGDQIEQLDARWLYGTNLTYERWVGERVLLTTGAQVRHDRAEVGLWHTEARTRLAGCFAASAPCNHTNNRIWNVGAFVEANISARPWLHVFPGLRVDQLIWDVEDLATRVLDGSTNAALVSPKLSVELHASEQVNFFINTGTGFHSNDARAAVTSKSKGALARAIGAEVGVRMRPAKTARVSADIWYLHLASEQVWSGDAGGTEASDPTHRFGLDLEGSVQVTPWLTLDGNVTWAKATSIALAPRWMGSGGVALRDRDDFVSLRARGIADRMGNDDGTLTAEGFLIFDIVAGKQLGRFAIELTITNLLNSDWREAQFAEESRVSETAPLVEQMHFTPGIPLTATLALSVIR
ncbi:MAG: TonB-dependent receptor [Deltaproteobacteria bacterium]|nr:TonB-dependent receptor [Deltaproteobacteria bacterium]